MDKTRYYISIVSFILLAAILSFSSCAPEYGGPNPYNYEDFVEEQDKHPAFSPDGEHIAYYHYSSQLPEPADYPSGLYIIDKNGNNRTLVVEGHHYNPAWSPDGEWLVFSSGGIIQKCKTNGESLTRFMGLDTLDFPSFYFPDWSNDGKYIVFDKAFRKQGDTSSVFYYTTPSFSITGILFDIHIISGRDPEISPTGKVFVYNAGLNSTYPSEIFLMDTTGSPKIQLTTNKRDNRGPTWSPNGSKIAWSSDVRVHTMNADGSNQKFLAYGQYPSWSINNEIVFSHANAGYTREVLYVIKPDGSGKRQITE